MKTLSLWRKKLRDKLRIILPYKIEITTIKDTTWIKKTLFFVSLTALFLTVYFLSYSLFFASLLLALTHTALQDCTYSLHFLGLHFFSSLCPNGRMASLFNSSYFPSFLLFTLFRSGHNKCKPLILTLLQPKYPFLHLPRPNGLAFYFFLFFLPSACPIRLSQPTHADDFCT